MRRIDNLCASFLSAAQPIPNSNFCPKIVSDDFRNAIEYSEIYIVLYLSFGCEYKASFSQSIYIFIYHSLLCALDWMKSHQI